MHCFFCLNKITTCYRPKIAEKYHVIGFYVIGFQYVCIPAVKRVTFIKVTSFCVNFLYRHE